MVLLHRKLNFHKDPEGVQHFPGGGGGGGVSNFFQGEGVQMLISIETHITCDFPDGGLDHLSLPLDPHLGRVGLP